MPAVVLLILFTVFIFSSPASAAPSWQQPTAEELSMTSQPETPGADAVYLNRDEIADDREESVSDMEAYSEDKRNFHTINVRLKILTEAGKRYADVVTVYPGSFFVVSDVQGRTIHSDGTVIPLVAKPLQSVIDKSSKFVENETSFSMPDVQVGSILEYRYTLRYDGRHVVAPEWYVQQDLFVRSASYHFRPNTHDIFNEHGELSNGCAYTSALPKGAAVKYSPAQNTYDLVVHNIPPIPSEESMPPLHSLSYRVLFYYTGAKSADDYWKSEGSYWSKDVNKFESSSKLRDAVSQIVAPGDSDQPKISKIYDAVMQVENTSFTREHSQAENRASGIRTKTADDIWEQKRGNAEEITLLFLAMAKAAGLKAYAMKVSNRDWKIFDVNYLTMRQLDDVIAIVQVDGKEQYFDPGERYCVFGQLHWKHTSTGGLRQTDAGTSIAQTPGALYTAAQTQRVAKLQLDPDGKLHGSITMKLAGVPALEWRQKGLQSDQAEVSKGIEDSVRRLVPPGVDVKVAQIVGLGDWKTLLVVQLDVSGSIGTTTSKRVFLPSNFFEAGSRPIFVHEKRETAVYLGYASDVQEAVTLGLPKNFAVESVPKDSKIPFPNNGLYVAQYTMKDNAYNLARRLILANFLFQPSDYGSLKDFYQKLTAQDHEQAILDVTVGTGGQ
jgi:hypothetical protein